MITLDLDDQVAQRATDRALREGWPDLHTLILQLVYRYAHGKDAATGGYQRAANMSEEDRSAAAANAAHARWATATDEQKTAAAKHASDARWGKQHRTLALARKLTAPKPKRVPAWPLAEDDEEGGTE
jgi:hypothetical protein